MTKPSLTDDESKALAEEAAEQLFNGDGSDDAPVYEPQDRRTARAAVQRLGELFGRIPRSIATALDAARSSGELLSSDRLQGLAEILQNADDAGASQVRLVLREKDLLMGHNGNAVRLPHVLALAMPWLSTKRGEAGSFGRFGIGLSTLRSLSITLDVHCGPYHVRLGDEPVLTPIDPLALPAGFDAQGWTIFRVPLTEGAVTPDELAGWLERWGDAGLLFLRNVAEICLRGSVGENVRQLSVRRKAATSIEPPSAAAGGTMQRQHVGAADGRSWMVYSADVPTPTGVSRVHKLTEPTTHVAVALPLHRAGAGQIYAGLPVVGTPLPVFVNAQFDPVASRRDLADTAWNRALVPLVTEVWSQAAVNLFRLEPQVAWQAMPTGPASHDEKVSSLVGTINATIVDSARHSVAARAAVEVDGKGSLGLGELAIEARPLEGLVTATETARLLGLPATLPRAIRDTDERWRSVLDDWREAGADLPKPLSVEQALDLFQDMTRPVQSTIALAAAGIRDGLGDRLLTLPCVVASDERRLVPPSEESPEAVALEVSPLARELGIVTALHSEHLAETDDAREVIDWLRERRAVLDGTNDRVVVHRLASAGRSGRRITKPLTDAQVDALRRAFELLDPAERRERGHDVGRAIVLAGYEYELRGGRKRRRRVVASPTNAYLPRSIDRGRDSFAVAADRSPGVVWLSKRYARALKSSAGRAGVGSQRFLALLGAETAPRPRAHSDLRPRYADELPGLPARCQDSPAARTEAMRDRGATYTLRDWDCPGLTAVVEDIARVRQGGKRRIRAQALLATMGRAWERLSDFSEVVFADDHYGWIEKGRMPAFWLWQARDIVWLDDESGTPRRPSELHIRTPGTEAIYGEDSPDFLHPDLHGPHLERRNWHAAMAALGVCGDPTRLELVARLKELRDGVESGVLATGRVERDAAIIYKALAESLRDSGARADLSETDLRREFRDWNGLVLTDLGWRAPDTVFAGPPVFGRYMAFAPPVRGTGPLWTVLRLKMPSLMDCVQILRRIARRRRPLGRDDEAIQIQTLRMLDERYRATGSPQDRRKLAGLRLWTSQGWMDDRPVFATDDASLAAGLADRLPLWQPGGELDQFRSLLSPLRVKEIRPADAEVIEPDGTHDDQDSTRLFRGAVQQLQEDLVRNEPQLAQSVRIQWDALCAFRVRKHPTLALAVQIPESGGGGVQQCDVLVRVDADRQIVFAREPQRDLPRADRGGRALATLFDGDRRRVAQAWRAAWDQAEGGRMSTPLELAQQKAQRRQEEIEADIDSELEALQARPGIKRRSANPRRLQGPPALDADGPPSHGGGAGDGDSRRGETRVLVDPQSLRVVDPSGRVMGSSAGGGRTPPRPNGGLVEPRERSRSPRNKVPLRGYSDLDRETVGLELARKVLSSDRDEIVDLRAQCGVGADAMDKLGRFYELKVSARDEPNQITLTNAEVRRAQNSPHFFLVVVSGVEGADARPTVRVIPRPLDQLAQSVSGTMTLSGVRDAKSVAYHFVPLNNQARTENERAAR